MKTFKMTLVLLVAGMFGATATEADLGKGLFAVERCKTAVTYFDKAKYEAGAAFLGFGVKCYML